MDKIIVEVLWMKILLVNLVFTFNGSSTSYKTKVVGSTFGIGAYLTYVPYPLGHTNKIYFMYSIQKP